ncbi:hypothetical protein [Mycoplasma sp. SG1]|uniref:hypothetical protein n=1 Tax=Mycoplasma sp. SG1 TaxID=2810348 RepID=UPI002023D204|nr:hypothetical protein [Mycoplasma sp. SG1]URM52819.1 hypothetical protein JRW51_00535 [Mycoplasma sp. SG1]
MEVIVLLNKFENNVKINPLLIELFGKKNFEICIDRLIEQNFKTIWVVCKEDVEIYKSALRTKYEQIKFISSKEELKPQSENIFVIEASNICLNNEFFDRLEKVIREKQDSIDYLLFISQTQQNEGYWRVIRNPQHQILELVPDQQKPTNQNPQALPVKEVYANMIYGKTKSILSSFDLAIFKWANNLIKKRNLRPFEFMIPWVFLIRIVHPAQLPKVVQFFNTQKIFQLLNEGAIIYSPQLTYISPFAKFGKRVSIHPFVVVDGNSEIGDDVVINSNAYLFNAKIPPNTIVKCGEQIVNSEPVSRSNNVSDKKADSKSTKKLLN